MYIPSYGIEHRFSYGENVIRFTPDKPGLYAYGCWMGMIVSTIQVIEPGAGGTGTAADLIEEGEEIPEWLRGAQGGCCGEGQSRFAVAARSRRRFPAAGFPARRMLRPLAGSTGMICRARRTIRLLTGLPGMLCRAAAAGGAPSIRVLQHVKSMHPAKEGVALILSCAARRRRGARTF